ncbi:hypothetical protein RH553_003573 [Salmonella enterica]|nr:hypothetical protein [Salmonella enterica]
MSDLFLMIFVPTVVGGIAGFCIAKLSKVNKEFAAIKQEMAMFRRDMDETRKEISRNCADELRTKLNSLDSYELSRIVDKLDEIYNLMPTEKQTENLANAIFKEVERTQSRIYELREHNEENHSSMADLISDVVNILDKMSKNRVIGFRPERLIKE